MKLWHDDVRPPPEGWTWAKTNVEALEHLRRGDVDECSLDHDLGAENIHHPLKMFMAGNSAYGSGYDLVVAMCDEGIVPPKVTIHSWNIPGAKRMAERLRDHGHEPYVAPFRA